MIQRIQVAYSNSSRWVNSKLWFVLALSELCSVLLDTSCLVVSIWSGSQRHYPVVHLDSLLWSIYIPQKQMSIQRATHQLPTTSETTQVMTSWRSCVKSWSDVNDHSTKIATLFGACKIYLESANQQAWSAKSGVRVETKWPGNHSKEAILAVWKPHSERWIIGVPEVKLQTKILFAASPRMKYITQAHNGYTTLWRISSILRSPLLHEFWLK